MPLFLQSLREGSECHTVESTPEGFTILSKDGREQEFNALARRVINTDGPYVAFPVPDGQGGYEAVHLVVTE